MFGQYLWPPRTAEQDQNSDIDDVMRVESDSSIGPVPSDTDTQMSTVSTAAVYDASGTQESGGTTSLAIIRDNLGHMPTFKPPAIIVMDSAPVPGRVPSPAPAPSMTGPGFVDSGHQRQRQRTPSPRGTRSNRNSPRPSPERVSGEETIRNRDVQQDPPGSKIRLINIPDLQQETFMKELKEFMSSTIQFLQNVEKDLLTLKQTAAATQQLAERADQRAIDTEKELEKQRTELEKRHQTLRHDIQEETSKQIYTAGKKTEAILKTIKNLEQAAPGQGQEITNQSHSSQTAADNMVVDQPQSDTQAQDKGKKRAVEISGPSEPEGSTTTGIPAPPRFPVPFDVGQSTASSPVPKPLNFRRPKSNGRLPPLPAVKKTFLNGEGEGSSTSEGEEDEDDEAPQKNTRRNISDLNGEEMLKLLLRGMGLNTENIDIMDKSIRRRAHRELKEPAKKAPKARGKQDVMNWLRQHLHLLLGIKRSRDILNFAAEIYTSGTPLQRHMEQWEKTKEGEAPKLKPMTVNWNNLDGPWNIHLCELFVQYCATQGLEGGNPEGEVNDFVAGYFWDRLVRLKGIIRKNRPKGQETPEQTSSRTKGQHLQDLTVARRNSRRNQKHHDRIDICLENLPENIDSITTDEQRDWKIKYDIVIALGPEGMSSDETDDSDPDTYWIRTMPWRSKRAMQLLGVIDDAKNITNGYGNVRPGNRPRNRQRGDKAKDTARKAPIGKSKNLYDPDWYNSLNAGKKKALKVKPDVPYA